MNELDEAVQRLKSWPPNPFDAIHRDAKTVIAELERLQTQCTELAIKAVKNEGRYEQARTRAEIARQRVAELEAITDPCLAAPMGNALIGYHNPDCDSCGGIRRVAKALDTERVMIAGASGPAVLVSSWSSESELHEGDDDSEDFLLRNPVVLTMVKGSGSWEQ